MLTEPATMDVGTVETAEPRVFASSSADVVGDRAVEIGGVGVDDDVAPLSDVHPTTEAAVIKTTTATAGTLTHRLAG